MTIRRWSGVLSLVLLAWAAVMVAMPFVGPGGRQVAVVGDASNAVKAIRAAGGQVIEVRRGATLARPGDARGFVRALYAHGAPLVIEGRIGAGCFSRRSS